MVPISITIQLSNDYYKAIFPEWLRYRSKYRKYQQASGAILVLIGLINTLIMNSFYRNWEAISIITILFGLLQFWDFYQSKRRWLRERELSRVAGEDVQMSFTAEGFHHIGPFATGDYKWTGIQQVQETRNGLFLIPGNRTSIYLPRSSFQVAQDFHTVKAYAQQHLLSPTKV